MQFSHYIQRIVPGCYAPGYSAADGVQVGESSVEVIPWHEDFLGGDPYTHLTLGLSRDVHKLQG